MTSSNANLNYRRILMRADGSSSIGMGHVVRSLVLARELLDLGAEVEVWGSSVALGKCLAPSFSPVPIRDQKNPGGKPNELKQILRLRPDLVITDGYHFRRDFFHSLSEAGIPYAVIDDNVETEAENPVFVLNQNPSAKELSYRARFPNQPLFLGPRWALIRREFRMLKLGEGHPYYDTFLSLGGSDIRGLTLHFARYLCRRHSSLAVAVGPAVPDRSTLVAKLRELPGVSLIEPAAAPAAMAKSRLLILGAGSSLLEANALAKKCIGLVVAENQTAPARTAMSLGLVSAVLDIRVHKQSEVLETMLSDAITAAAKQAAPTRKIRTEGANEMAIQVLFGPGS